MSHLGHGVEAQHAPVHVKAHKRGRAGSGLGELEVKVRVILQDEEPVASRWRGRDSETRNETGNKGCVRGRGMNVAGEKG